MLAARAYRLAILDGVHLDLADVAGFAAACRQGREFGFDGKTLIHPMQIEAANSAFAGSAEEVAKSRRVIAAHAAAEASGEGVVLVDGRLVEKLHVEDAYRLLALAAAIERMAAGAGSGRALVDTPPTAV
jgi:citrate lyase subunit beta/citryl-CoA lyase